MRWFKGFMLHISDDKLGAWVQPPCTLAVQAFAFNQARISLGEIFQR